MGVEELNVIVIRVSERVFGTLIRDIYPAVINRCLLPPPVTSPTPRRGSDPDEEWVKKKTWQLIAIGKVDKQKALFCRV